jgi:hypothetical protein
MVAPWSPEDAVLVLPVYGRREEVRHFADVCRAAGVKMAVYDKEPGSAGMDAYISDVTVLYRAAANLGREQETYLAFVAEFYDRLPETLYLVPGNCRHGRLERFRRLLCLEGEATGCTSHLGPHAGFTLEEYDGVALAPASVRPFQAWFERFVGEWTPAAPGPAWQGVLKTRRSRLLQRPQSSFQGLLEQLRAGGDSPEAAHYMERAMAAVF